MEPRPTEDTRWATGGSASVTEPSSGRKDLGFVAGAAPPAGWFNWLFELLARFVRYLDGMSVKGTTAAIIRNFQVRTLPTVTYDVSGIALRPSDGTLVAVGASGRRYVGGRLDVFTAIADGSIVFSGGDPIRVAYLSNADIFATARTNPASSPNGTAWTERAWGTPANMNAASAAIYAIEFLNLFVAFAFDGSNNLETSANGTSWTTRSAHGSAANYVRDMAENGTIAVAVLSDGVNVDIMTSTNGFTWTIQTIPAITSPNLISVTYNAEGGYFLALGKEATDAIVLKSFDGVTWTKYTIGTASAPSRIRSTASGLNLAFIDASVYASYDGVTWEKLLDIESTMRTSDVLVGGSELLWFVRSTSAGTFNQLRYVGLA